MTKVKGQISNECQMTNAKKYVTVQGFKVQWFTPALARLDMHYRNDRTEFYSRSFYTTGEESQIWARGSRLNGGGGSRIRTHGTSRHNGFQDRLLKPLGHPSNL